MTHINLDAAIEAAIDTDDYNGEVVYLHNVLPLEEVTGLSEGVLMYGRLEARTALEQAGIHANYRIFERDSFGIVSAGYAMHYQGLILKWAF